MADALQAAGVNVLGFTDADPAKHQLRQCGLPVLGSDATVLTGYSQGDVLLANGVGGVKGTDVRRALQMRLQELGWRFITVLHPTAIVSRHASVGSGAQLLAGSIVQAAAMIGEGAIVNTGAIVEHDTDVGDYVHVAPRALLCGAVKVGKYSHIGAGAIVRQGICLGQHTMVGAGAVVVKDFDGGGDLVGMPARHVKGIA
ncbi:MAG: acetyltransferase [Proteobacteria bacterium]|nr:acetyltransferase [Pseudomonadota bacterium]